MAKFDDLPLELVIKIIELSIEDAIALDEFQPTKNICLQLSLVSKDFTLPTQRALWRAIYGMHFDSFEFMRVIGEGVGKDKKIDNLAFVLEESGEKAFDGLLNGVAEGNGVAEKGAYTMQYCYWRINPMDPYILNPKSS